MIWPIYVPSKGRAQTAKLIARLQAEKIAAHLVVEPQEAAAYSTCWPDLQVLPLPADNQGLTFSRNHILQEGRRLAHPWIWMLDDDVSAILHSALLAAQQEAGPGVGQIALEYQQFAWSAAGRVKQNSYCDVMVAIRTNPTLSVSYRDVPLKEDRDLTMQIVHRGYDTRRVTAYAFSAPSVGSNKGGLHDEYRAGRDRLGAAKLTELWPWCCEVQTKPSGRVDAKIHWKRIRQQHALC